MYRAYEQYWLAILANPDAVLPYSGRVASKNEIAYARLADKTPTSSFPQSWTRSLGRQRVSFDTWTKFER
jgi:hypothetical protein